MFADFRSVAAMVRIRFLFLLDAGLLLAVALLQSPRGTSLTWHEWLGMALAALVAVHLLVNWRWIAGTLRRMAKPDSRRARINALLNGMLFTFMALTVFSGFAISEVVLPLLGLQASTLNAWRELHDLLATLSVVTVGLHLGLNWDWIAGVMRKRLLAQGADKAAAARELEIAGPSGKEDEGELRRGTFSSVMKALGLHDLRTMGRRLGGLSLAVAAVWASCFVLVESMASRTIRDEKATSMSASSDRDVISPAQRSEQRPLRERVWTKPRLTVLAREVGVQLLIIGVATVAGRKLLRLRL
ncbi:MAG TPA: DUF4405 domain-containing protein [Candidatus Angelobacter sp.]